MIPDGMLQAEHDRLYRAQRTIQSDARRLRRGGELAIAAGLDAIDRAERLEGAATEIVERRVRLWLEANDRRGARP